MMIPKTYPQDIVQPMKNELLNAGFKEFSSLEELKNIVQGEGSVFVVINSVCGCSARGARPSAIKAIQNAKYIPNKIYTVFAGYDMEELELLRELCLPYPPSSPSMVLFKDGKVVHFLERRQIEGNHAETIEGHLIEVFHEYCAEKSVLER